MADTTTLIDTYLAAYGETDADRRTRLINESFAADGSLTDPPFVATGHDQLHGTFGAVQEQFPGHTFRRTSGIDEHHGTARYRWDLVAPDGAVTLSGMDVVTVEGGRIRQVVGFFEPLPPLNA